MYIYFEFGSYGIDAIGDSWWLWFPRLDFFGLKSECKTLGAQSCHFLLLEHLSWQDFEWSKA